MSAATVLSGVCPRCSNGLPICTDVRPDGHPYTHAETCATYKWADDVCDDCKPYLDADAQPPREAWAEGLPIWWALQDDVLSEKGLRTLTDICHEVYAKGSGHQAEAWRKGYEPRVEFGWHCLTCGEEGTAFSATVAESLAAAHMREKGSTQAGESRG